MLAIRERVRRPEAADRGGSIEEIERLEELWAVSAEPSERVVLPALRRTGRALLGPALALGWIAFLVSVFFEPTPAHTDTPLWADYVILGFWLALAAAGILAAARAGRWAWGAATVAGAFGLGLAVACKATEHHLGAWWLYELGATGALTLLALAGLARRRDRS